MKILPLWFIVLFRSYFISSLFTRLMFMPVFHTCLVWKPVSCCSCLRCSSKHIYFGYVIRLIETCIFANRITPAIVSNALFSDVCRRVSRRNDWHFVWTRHSPASIAEVIWLAFLDMTVILMRMHCNYFLVIWQINIFSDIFVVLFDCFSFVCDRGARDYAVVWWNDNL